ncbi:unnamed protein product [Lupinus luteus]|uniref:LCR n=1 Tax=Lupinus luteus TaxID=3873 RepID=A0AAV1W145_LUPLU
MASRTYQAFLIGIVCIAFILTSGPTMVKAEVLKPTYVCELPCFGGVLKESICNTVCLKKGYTKGGSCREGACCCKLNG